MVDIERIKQLSVRIESKSGKLQGSGLLYVVDNKKAYVLTAAHVVFAFKDNEIICIRCWPGEENLRIFEVDRSEAKTLLNPEQKINEWDARDVALIPLEMTEEKDQEWMRKLPRAFMAIPDRIPNFALEKQKVIGVGYSQKSEGYSLKLSVTEYGREACCCAYDNHRMTCKLYIDVGSASPHDVIGGMSGSVLALADSDDIVLIGVKTGINKKYELGVSYCVDLSCVEELLVKQGVEIRKADSNKLQKRKPGERYGKYCLLQDHSFVASRQKEFDDLLKSIKDSSVQVINIWGMPGIGKTEIALTLNQLIHDRSVCYLECKEPDNESYNVEELMERTIMQAVIPHNLADKDDYEHRLQSMEKDSTRIIVFDNFKVTSESWDDLKRNTSLGRLCEKNIKLILISTCPIEGAENYRIDAPEAKALWGQFRKAVSGLITEEYFTHIANLVGRHPTAVKSIIEYVKKQYQYVSPSATQRQALCEAIQRGNFQEVELSEGRTLATVLNEKFPLLDDHKEVLQLLAYLSEKGIKMQLLDSAIKEPSSPINPNPKHNPLGYGIEKYKKKGWLIENDDGVISIPTIIRLLYGGKGIDEACGFYEKIWKGNSKAIADDKGAAAVFANTLSQVRLWCPLRERCSRKRCWTWLPEVFLWWGVGDDEKKNETLKAYRKLLSWDSITDLFDRAKIDYFLDRKDEASLERIVKTGELILKFADHPDNQIKDAESIAEVACDLGNVYLGCKRPDEAIKYFEMALRDTSSKERQRECLKSMMACNEIIKQKAYTDK